MAAGNYNRNVFINCPFDNNYTPLFQAILFTVADCGFIPRCALEAQDSGDVRIQKIMAIIDDCRFGIHDISRTETSAFVQPDGSTMALPRFNMPLELGIFMGAQHFGRGRHQQKNYIVLDHGQFRYQQFISDLAGQDIKVHGWQGSPPEPQRSAAIASAITQIRNWLATKTDGQPIIGGPRMANRFERFTKALPVLADQLGQQHDALTFSDLTALIQSWVDAIPAPIELPFKAGKRDA